MSEDKIYVPLEYFERMCKAEAELEVVKRYLTSNEGYSSLNELRIILGMGKKDDE